MNRSPVVAVPPAPLARGAAAAHAAGMTAPPDIPPDRSPDAPVTPARRLGRAAGRFSRPLLWALAGLGLAITLVPRSTGGDVREPDSMRGLSRITVDANAGSMWGDASPWHPRFLTVTVLGPELPPDPRWPAEAGRWERDNDAVPYALRWYAVANPRCVRLPAAGLMGGVGADREGFYRLDAALNGGFFGEDPGRMCRVVGASVSLWSLVLPAAAWGAWRVRRGDRPRSPRATLRRRLARPWAWGLAGLGAAALVGSVPDLPDGRGGAVSAALAVNRGPAGVPHPRTVSTRLDWVDPPPWALAPFCPPPDPPGDVRDEIRTLDRPRVGLWASVRGIRYDDAPQGFYASAAVSLWWLAAAALGGNLWTLARHRRGRRR